MNNFIQQSILEDNTFLSQWFSQINEPFIESLSRSSSLPLPPSPPSTSPSSNSPSPLSLLPPVIEDCNCHDIISFSHFLPRQELLPEKRFLLEPNLSKVTGSNILESQIRRLGSNLHIVCLLFF